VIDHILVDLITAIRRSFDEALLQRQAVEERFQVDVFLGDVSFETSYSLPGEEEPPRVRADLSIDWPTWSQTAYRSWSIGEGADELPEVVVEVALRVQRLAETPDAATIRSVFPAVGPSLGGEPLSRTSTTVEDVLESEADGGSGPSRYAVEAAYEGSMQFEEGHLEHPETLRPLVDPLARWVASTLVALADLPLRFLPAEQPER